MMDLLSKTAAHSPSMCNLEFATNRRGKKYCNIIIHVCNSKYFHRSNYRKTTVMLILRGWSLSMMYKVYVSKAGGSVEAIDLHHSNLSLLLIRYHHYTTATNSSGVYYKLRPYGKYFVEHKLKQ
jgi:hypothetical protein